MTQQTTTKQVTVLAVYKFNKVARICFETLSSNGNDHYHTCFQGNGRESCSCPSKGGCYHRDGLRERAQAYFESQKQGNTSPATAESQIVNVTMGTTTISEPISNLGNAVAHHIWAKRMLAEVKEDPTEKAEREARLQREADAMVEQAHRKYDAPLCRQQEDWSSPDAPIYSDVKPLATVANRGTLNGHQGFQLMR